MNNQIKASYYKEGKRTANGEHFNPMGMTAAHRKLPFGTKLQLEYKGKTAIVRINDRGPFIKGVDLDVTLGVAKKLGFVGQGHANLNVKIIKH